MKCSRYCILKDILMKVSASTLSYRYVKREKIYHGFCCTYNEGEDLFVRARQRVIKIWDFKLAVVLTVMTSSSRRKHGTLPAGRSYLPGIVAITIIHLVLVWGNSTHGYSCFCAFVRFCFSFNQTRVLGSGGAKGIKRKIAQLWKGKIGEGKGLGIFEPKRYTRLIYFEKWNTSQTHSEKNDRAIKDVRWAILCNLFCNNDQSIKR